MMTNGMGPNPKANDLRDNMSCAEELDMKHIHNKGGDCDTRQSYETIIQPIADSQVRKKSASN
jgi:hypothetical protein